MRVDKEDRYISEPPSKDSTTLLKLSSFLQSFSKKKLIILGSVITAFLLLLSLIIFYFSSKKETAPLTPPVVNGVASVEETSNTAINDEQNNIEIGENQSNMPQLTVNDDLSVIDNQNTTSTQSTNTKKNNHKRPVNHKNEKTDLGKDVKIESNHYVIQLSASKSVEGLKKFVKKNDITDYQIYETKHKSGSWFILIKGNYSSAEEANKALKSLPTTLLKDKPWVKSGKAVDKEKAAK